ncbi:hypothetical protein DXT76_17030 [Halobacillus trueperi]|uniref:Uncharacterized protein n=1 Tax=Halobacillus trueperi TaxID=156205 RepID=A0A3D8VJJ9_9BACI|nr:hypothetical protein [Halobacillus trueperi]RDY69008.1 hypothetical protein DXT76_17030 [Halobacillus trueperi]
MGDLIPFPKKEPAEVIVLTPEERQEFAYLTYELMKEDRLIPFLRIKHRLKKLIKRGLERAKQEDFHK